jgi:hypothetical protein
MSDSIAGLGVVTDSTYGHGHQPDPGTGGTDKPESETKSFKTSDPADLRLIIEDDLDNGVLIYKTLDCRTGRVVQALGRDQLLKMRQARNYVAGQVIKTRA